MVLLTLFFDIGSLMHFAFQRRANPSHFNELNSQLLVASLKEDESSLRPGKRCNLIGEVHDFSTARGTAIRHDVSDARKELVPSVYQRDCP